MSTTATRLPHMKRQPHGRKIYTLSKRVGRLTCAKARNCQTLEPVKQRPSNRFSLSRLLHYSCASLRNENPLQEECPIIKICMGPADSPQGESCHVSYQHQPNMAQINYENVSRREQVPRLLKRRTFHAWRSNSRFQTGKSRIVAKMSPSP